MQNNTHDLRRKFRFWLAVFIFGLVISGVTAFPLETELKLLTALIARSGLHEHWPVHELQSWLITVRDALVETNAHYPFLAYGFDWLAFAHLMIAVAFIGAWREPVKNAWLITFGFIACASVIPLALIAGAIRGIPFYWRLVDCSFGIFGFIPLLFCRRYLAALEKIELNSVRLD